MLKACIVGLAIGIATSAMADPVSYLCVPEGSVGFRLSDKDAKWYPEAFATPEKYILRSVEIEGRDERVAAIAHVSEPGVDQVWGFFDFKKGPSDGGSIHAFCRK